MLTELRHRLDTLRTQSRFVAKSLAIAAEALERDGLLPSAELLASCQAMEDEGRSIAAEVYALTNRPTPESSALSLDVLAILLAELPSREQNKTLASLYALSHQEHSDFPPLHPVQRMARALYHAPYGAEERSLFAAGNHPLARLHRFLTDGAALSDEEWETLRDAVAQEFSPGLAAAISRGKVLFPPEPIAPPLAPASEAMATQGTEASDSAIAGAGPVAAQPEPAEPAGAASGDSDGAGSDDQAAVPKGDLEALQVSPPVPVPVPGAADQMELVPTVHSWDLIAANRAPLARLIALGHEALGGAPPLPAGLIEALVLAPSLRFADGAIGRRLQQLFPGLLDLGGSQELQLRLLVAAAALRPALLAPVTGAPDLLRGLHLPESIPELGQLLVAAADYGSFGMPLEPSALQAVQDEAARQSALKQLAEHAASWLQRAPLFTITYQPAQQVLRRWLEPDGLLSDLLAPVTRDATDQAPAVKELLDRFGDDAALRREIDRVDRKVLNRRVGEPIGSHALTQLLQRAREAMALARRWCDLRAEQSGGTAPGFFRQQASQLRTAVCRTYPGAVAELERITTQEPSGPLAVAVQLLRRSLADVRSLFEPGAMLPESEPDVRYLLQSDLLFIPGVALDDDWQPVATAAASLLPQLEELAGEGAPSSADAFRLHLDLRDLEAALRLLEYLEEQGVDTAAMRQERESRLAECRDALRRHITIVQGQIETAVAYGLLREPERLDLTARVSVAEVDLPRTLRFGPAHDALQAVTSIINDRRAAEADAVRLRLAGAGAIGEEAAARIEKALAAGDVLTANEYLDMVADGKPLPEQAPGFGAIFADFWPDRAAQIGEAVERMAPRQLVKLIADQTGVRGLKMSDVPGAQAKQAADMLDAWLSAKGAQRVVDEHAHRILTGLGFDVITQEQRRISRHTWISVTCRPIRDKEHCPVAAYGSGAAGRYRILCVWDRPTEEDLLNAVGDTAQGMPVLVFYFGRMSEKRRRDLARLCRERRRTFLVIDDILMLYLCSVRGARLPVMFDCTLPFTFLEPYTTRAGMVPPEVFYGRRRERDAILDFNGSCFIYGGRQLGKTALLRDVARSFHQPDQGRVTVYLDLKAEGIGHDRPVDDLWHLISSALKAMQVLPPAIPAHASTNRLLDGIAGWLSESPERRLLLLLDEADRLLEVDGREEYKRSARLKGLMDRTDRRFKVVFAGLHNVQRSTRRANHPLAHYGESICIGPLLENSEWKEARALIERPLACLGYTFEDPDLVTRILSQTNYFPSLIQLYAQQLLRHLQSLPSPPDPRMPAHVITARHVEEAYRNGDLRKAIRDRFMWTLQLDERYEMIAFALAYQARANPAHPALVEGLSVSAIRTEALSWWPAGFGDGAPEDAFRVLLEEMVGLGILRSTPSGAFTLRSPNVVLLMGTVEEIEAQLQRTREAPVPYEPDTFRGAFRLPSGSDPSRRSPLTALQESELRLRRSGVTLLFGNEASGLATLGEYLEGLIEQDLFVHAGAVMDRAAFVARLEQTSRLQDGVTVLYVPHTCPWTDVWVQEADRHIGRLRSRSAHLRVVFAADPHQTLQLVSQFPAGFDGLRQTSVLSLQPWHDHALRQWLDENSLLPNDPVTRDRIRAVTGNWPAFIYQIPRGTRAGAHRWVQSLDKLEAEQKSPEVAAVWRRQLGLDRKPLQRVLSLLQKFPGTSAAELEGVLEGPEAAGTFLPLLRAAELLHLAQRTSGDTWEIVNPAVARLVDEGQL